MIPVSELCGTSLDMTELPSGSHSLVRGVDEMVLFSLGVDEVVVFARSTGAADLQRVSP